MDKQQAVIEAETELIKKLNRMLGYVPVGFKDTLHNLSHPDLIDLTWKWLDAVDESRK